MDILSYKLGKNASGGGTGGNVSDYFNMNKVIGGTGKIYDYIKKVPTSIMDFSNLTSCSEMFSNCTGLEEVELFDTSNITNFQRMFSGCGKLKTIPIFDTSRITTFTNTFSGCISLSNESLDNILQMCIGATSYTGGGGWSSSKALKDLGFNATNYPAATIQALPHYQDFINAGWKIGY